MTYDEWADEYLKSAKSTELKIKECERKMKGCRNCMTTVCILPVSFGAGLTA